MEPDDIAIAAGWHDDANDLINALLKVRFLEEIQSGAYVLHDWETHNAYAANAEKRSDAARLAAKKRWSHRLPKCDSDADLCEPHPDGNAPIPYPTPNPNINTSPANADILKKIDGLAEELYEHGRFPKVHAFKNKALKLNKNAYALCHTLERLSVAKNINPESAWAYCAKILGVENGNYNEEDFRKRAEQQRRDLEKFAAENELNL